ncbi:MAG: undecaprenyl-diphosphate phosphatase [Fidelibacterota bacterium]
MTVIDAIFMGILQGLTEFLPISSSGHLVVGQALLGIHIPGKAVEVVVHTGTLFSILVVFKNDWFNLLRTVNTKDSKNYIIYILIGTIPAAIVGILFEQVINRLFENVILVGITLIVTGSFLLTTKWFPERNGELSPSKSVLIGLAQAVAIIPGISRSGATISSALALGLKPQQAARFSFLLAVPAIAGAALLTGIDFVQNPQESLNWVVLGSALLSSFFVGVFALKWLLKLIGSGQLYWFSFYCFFLGGLVLMWT